MKILFDHSSPFFLAHGGVQVQIEQTKAALLRAGIDANFVQWWDGTQQADVLHYFGTVPNVYLQLARQKQIPVVLTTFFSETCNRSDLYLSIQGLVTRGMLALPGWGSIKAQLHWLSYRNAFRIIVGTQAESRVLQTVYGIGKSKISIVPLGLNKIYFEDRTNRPPEDYLISVGTIRDVKRSLELADLARRAKVPILFVGNPYSEDQYWHRFQKMIDNQFVLHRGHVKEPVELKRLLSSARGFVLYSRYENWSLAAHEAAACGLPLLLPDLKWSRECFGDDATYFQKDGSKANAKILRDFCNSAPNLPSPRKGLYSWDDVAKQLIEVYNKVLAST